MRNAWLAILGVVTIGVAAATAACGDASLDPGGMSHRGSYGAGGGAADSVDPTDPAATGSDPAATAPGATDAPDSGAPGTTPAPVAGSGCTSCHGDAARVAVAGADPAFASAPPRGSKGETATSQLAVGAHQAHVGQAVLTANPIQCNECHVVPTSLTHSNGVDDITFGTLAKTGGVSPAWNAGAGSCGATYCHGNFTGGANATPSWTGGAQTCTSCHGASPSTGHHKTSGHGVACSTCHGTGYNATASTVNKALHINGQINAGGNGSTITYTAATKSCTPSGCHGTRTW